MLDRVSHAEAPPALPPLLLLPSPGVEVARPASPQPEQQPGRARALSATRSAVLLAILWAALTGGDPASWAFGGPAVVAGAAIAFLLPPSQPGRVSPFGALGFAVWFAAQSLRGAVDVARRAFDPRMPLRPGFRSYTTALPAGPARIVMVNTITLLPGTLTAELNGNRLVVHMLDTRADLAREMGAVEARVRALFALPDPAAAGTLPPTPETCA